MAPYELLYCHRYYLCRLLEVQHAAGKIDCSCFSVAVVVITAAEAMLYLVVSPEMTYKTGHMSVRPYSVNISKTLGSGTAGLTSKIY